MAYCLRELFEEFRKLYNSVQPSIAHPDAIVALSAPQIVIDGLIVEKSPENIARIKTGIELAIACAQQYDLALNENHLIKNGPTLILNGETEQLPAMVEIAVSMHYPKISLVNSGDRGKSHTGTQIARLNCHLSDGASIIIVTSGYHVPRTTRTADKYLGSRIRFEVVPVPFNVFPYSVWKIKGEIKKILRYFKNK